MIDYNPKTDIRYLTAIEEKEMFEKLIDVKYKLIAAIMIDCGLRVSECVELRISDFNFFQKHIMVSPKKKRKDVAKVEIPITNRIIEYAAEYWKTLRDKNGDAYMFPAANYKKRKNHLTRIQVWRVLNRACGIHPHILRHTCATKLIEKGTELHVVKELLRHNSIATTELYVHTSKDRKRRAVNTLENRNIVKSVMQYFFPSKALEILPLSSGSTNFHIGRKNEIQKITENTEKKINTILLAPQGMGKSQLLDALNLEKCFRIDDLAQLKKTLADICLMLCDSDKEKVAELLEVNTKEVATKYSPKRLLNLLESLTQEKEYTLIFDSVDKITATNIPILERLSKHFHVIAAARSVEVKNASWLSSYEKVELPKLSEKETFELIEINCTDFRDRIESYHAFRQHIYASTQGIPLYTIEMLDRYRKEKIIRADDIATIQHTNARTGVSFAPVLFGLVMLLALSKFWAREAMSDDKEAFMLIGGASMLFLVFGRMLFTQFKQKYI